MRTLGEDPDGIGAIARLATVVYLRRHPAAWPYFDELLSDASEGAVRAVRRFDPSRGVPLRAFCYRRAAGAILDGQRERSPVGRGAYHQGVRFDDLTQAQRPAVGLVRDNADGETYEREIPDPAAEADLARVDDIAQIEEMLSGLPERQRWIVTETYLDGRTLLDVAGELGVTEAAVCFARSRAIRKMREGAAA